MLHVIQRNSDDYYYRGRGAYPPWVNDLNSARIYPSLGAAKNSAKWAPTKPEFLDFVPVKIERH